MEFLDTVWSYLEPIWAWLKAGILAHHPASADAEAVAWLPLGVQMGVIALVMALLMQAYGAILIFTVVGVIVHVVVDIVLPIVRDGAQFSLEAIAVQQLSYWQYLAFAALVYLVAITVLFLVKSLIFRRGD